MTLAAGVFLLLVGAPVLPPEAAEAITAAFREAGLELRSARIERDRVNAQVCSADGCTRALLTYPDPSCPGLVTPHWCVHITEAGSDATRAALLRALRAPGARDPWRRPEAPPPEHPLARTLVLAAAAALALALLLLLLLLSRSARPRAPTWRRLSLLLLPGLAAFAVRAFLLGPELLQENHHGLAYLQALWEGRGAYFGGIPSSYLLLVGPLSRWLGGDAAVFWVNATLAACTAPLLGALAARLFARPLAGPAAAWAFALFGPLALLGPSELFVSFTLFLFAAAPLALARGLDPLAPALRRALWLLAGLALLVLEAQSRVLTLLHAPALLLLALAALPPTARIPWRTLFATGTLGAVALLPQALSILQGAAHDAGRGLATLTCLSQNLTSRGFVAWDPTMVSPALTPLAAAGLVALRHPRHTLLGALGALLIVAAPALSGCACPLANLRYQAPLLLLLLLLAAGAIAHLTADLRRGHLPLMLLLLGALCLPTPLLWAPRAPGQEYALLRERVLPLLAEAPAVPLLIPGPAGLVNPTPRAWWTRHLGREPLGSSRDHAGPAYAWVGLECSIAPETGAADRYPAALPGAPRLRAACTRALGPGPWEPVATLQLPAATLQGSCLETTARSIPLGLYRRPLPAHTLRLHAPSH